MDRTRLFHKLGLKSYLDLQRLLKNRDYKILHVCQADLGTDLSIRTLHT